MTLEEQVRLAAAACRDPDGTARLGLNLLERLANHGSALRELGADPAGVSRLVGLLGASPWLGQLMIGQPELTDVLLPARYRYDLPALAELRDELLEELDRLVGDEEAEMMALRRFKHRRVLHILALDLVRRVDLDGVSHALSELAELLLATVLTRVAQRRGFGERPPLGIVGYGKLGSREMSYASDTDIVFLHASGAGVPQPELVDLARTVNAWITTVTPAGALYATDFRLRPYGESGNLVSSFAAFRDYQINEAWTWEHQALTRARWLAGDPQLGSDFYALRADVLGRPREPARLRRDVLAMRERIFASHGRVPAGLVDVKHSRGGIIDVEFAVQYTVLRHAATHPALLTSTASDRILAGAAGLGLLPSTLAGDAALAYRQYRLWMHAERLQGNERIRVSRDEAEPHRRAVLALWEHVLEESASDGGAQ